jgi:hypothetical protein
MHIPSFLSVTKCIFSFCIKSNFVQFDHFLNGYICDFKLVYYGTIFQNKSSDTNVVT